MCCPVPCSSRRHQEHKPLAVAKCLSAGPMDQGPWTGPWPSGTNMSGHNRPPRKRDTWRPHQGFGRVPDGATGSSGRFRSVIMTGLASFTQSSPPPKGGSWGNEAHRWLQHPQHRRVEVSCHPLFVVTSHRVSVPTGGQATSSTGRLCALRQPELMRHRRLWMSEFAAEHPAGS